MNAGSSSRARFTTAAAISLLLAARALFAADQPVPEAVEKNRIVVEAFDVNGKFLRSGLAFIYDPSTVVCSYATVQRASVIKAQIDELRSYTNRIVASNRALNLAFLRTDEEIPEINTFGGSDTVAAGDTLYYYVRSKTGWKVGQGTAQKWVDSGQGYSVLRLQLAPVPADATLEPSPLLNAAGKIVGWFSGKDPSAISLRAIDELLQNKTASVSFTELTRAPHFWEVSRIKPAAGSEEQVQLDGTITYAGNQQFPFRVDLPERWTVRTFKQADKFLLNGIDPQFGISVGLRVVERTTDDLRLAVEKTETLIFPESARVELVPYSAQKNFSGFKAVYEDTQPDANRYSSTVFYSILGKNLYVLSLTYPSGRSHDLQTWIDQILSSLRL